YNTFHTATFRGDAYFFNDNVFDNLNFTAGHTYIPQEATTQTVNERWMIQGSCISYIVLQTTTPGIPATFSKPSGDMPGFNIHVKDIIFTGGANFIAYNSVDLGGNSGWDFATLQPLADPGPVIGPSVICTGATGVVYHTAPVPGSIYYEWTVPQGA